MELLSPHDDGTPFSFWGTEGRLELNAGLIPVCFRYETEPPHGDFLYFTSLDGRFVTDRDSLRLFWGRNMVVSSCGQYLATNEFRPKHRDRFCVISLQECTEWFKTGYVKLHKLEFPRLVIQEYLKSARLSAIREMQLPPKKSWQPVATSNNVPRQTVAWGRWSDDNGSKRRTKR